MKKVSKKLEEEERLKRLGKKSSHDLLFDFGRKKTVELLLEYGCLTLAQLTAMRRERC